MGSESSKMPAVVTAESMFTSAEKLKIKEHLSEMMISPQAFGFNQPAWDKFVGGKLNKQLSDRLFLHMLKVENEAGVKSPRLISPDGYVIVLSQYLKGSVSEKVDLLLGLCGQGEGVMRHQIEEMLKLLLADYCKYVSNSEAYSTWKLKPYNESTIDKLARCITADLPEKGEIPVNSLENWLSTSILLLQVLDNLMHYVFPMDRADDDVRVQIPIFPQCEHANWKKHGTMLDIPTILFLNQHIPLEHQSPWRLCFSTEAHGESFSNLVKHIVDQGPSIMLIKDTDGRVYGGFASQSWQLGPHFLGNSRCFLFSVTPEMAAYHPSGKNENYMYFNQGQETMPNGIGFGGQLNYFGLWLDYEFGQGLCKAEPKCTTFDSPQFSAEPKFNLNTLEVWGLGKDPKLIKLENEEGEEKKESILDKDPAAKAMLSLVGKGPLSEGLRETDPTASSPEEHKTFMS